MAHYNGSYTVLVTDTNGCQKLTNGYNLNNLDVNNVISASEIKIYPNPATYTVQIDYPYYLDVAVCSMEGKTVAEYKNSKEIDISNLASGLYLMVLTDENGNRIKVEKLIKQ